MFPCRTRTLEKGSNRRRVIGEELFIAFAQPPASVDTEAFAKKLVEVITQATEQNPARADSDTLFFL